MKKAYFLILGLTLSLGYSQNPVTDSADWTVSNITADNELDFPNEITYGPDGYLWITEREGLQVVKVSPADGTHSKIVMLDLSAVVSQSVKQDGLLGFAVHPDLYTDINTSNNYVYIAYTYDNSGRELRIARYTYNAGTGLLDSGSATTIIEGIPASNDHNGGRIKIGPDLKLYYGVGDQGFNQGNDTNSCTEIRAQVLPSSTSDYDEYTGKVLRLNLDGTIPSDNPTLGGIQSHVFSLGHRNPQGLIFSQSGRLYSSEHGPKVDDELNIIEAGMNYGWPEISGYYDDMGYEFCNWATSVDCADFGNNSPCPGDVTSMPESVSGMPTNFTAPIGTYNSTVASNPGGGWLSWPTVGPSSIDIYEGGLIPGWGESLLITTLKRGTIFRTQLNASGDGLFDGTYEEFHSSNDRYRDIAVDPDGVTFYAITDNTGGTSGPSGTTSVPIENPGVIVKIQFVGATLSTPEQIVETGFKMYPNPASESFKIEINEQFFAQADLTVKIMDIHGRMINSTALSQHEAQLSTAHLSNGIYFIELINGGTRIGNKKLIIQQ